MSDLSVVILAAGQGTRMRSNKPKVLHEIAGKPMLQHVVDTSNNLGAKNIYVVYGHGGEQVKAAISDEKITWIKQIEQLGTGHAVQQAQGYFSADDNVLILYGDVPLIHQDTLFELLDCLPQKGLALLTNCLDDPSGYGRIKRDEKNKVIAIVEQKDATEDELSITEVNTGVLAAKGADLSRWLDKLSNDNAQGEYYLTDVIGFAAEEHGEIITAMPNASFEVEGVNNRAQLANLERIFQYECAMQLMAGGVTMTDPNRFDLRGKLICETDVTIDANVIIEGTVKIGSGSYIGSNTILIDSTLGSSVNVKPNSIVERASIGNDCSIGPFARIRPGTEMANNSHIGNFVEIKNSKLGSNSKANHLAYVGDANVGDNVNIGAGTITCNYDGANKHKTVIEDGAFIGSDSQLVAPVTIGKNATVGAGSTISRDVSADVLCVTRVKQKEILGWQRPTKNKD